MEIGKRRAQAAFAVHGAGAHAAAEVAQRALVQHQVGFAVVDEQHAQGLALRRVAVGDAGLLAMELVACHQDTVWFANTQYIPT